MAKNWNNFRFKTWHFILVLLGFIILSSAIGNIKLNAMPTTDGETAFVDLKERRELDDNKASEISLIFFYSKDSEICSKMEYNLDQVAKSNNKNFKYYKVDVDKHPEECITYNISGVPNTIILKKNKEVDRIMGIVPISNIELIYTRIIK